MKLIGPPVVRLQLRDAVERRLNLRASARPHTRKQRQLLIGRVLGRSLLEIPESSHGGRTLLVRQGSAASIVSNTSQDPQEEFDPTVTVAQQAERLLKAVLRCCADLYRHAAARSSSSIARGNNSSFSTRMCSSKSDSRSASPW